jgi:hypothetical protein
LRLFTSSAYVTTKPLLGKVRDRFQGTVFFKQVGSAGHDFKCLLAGSLARVRDGSVPKPSGRYFQQSATWARPSAGTVKTLTIQPEC